MAYIYICNWKCGLPLRHQTHITAGCSAQRSQLSSPKSRDDFLMRSKKSAITTLH